MSKMSGYTVIEVMIVLSITGILFVAAITVFAGQQGKTGFSQSVQDLQSKIQSYATAVNSGTEPYGGYYSCTINSGRPILTVSGSSNFGSNQDCILLGRAIYITPGSNNLDVYTVLGTRTVYNAGVDTGVNATTVTQASPTPAMTYDGTNYYNVLNSNFKLSGGTTFKSSKINNGGSSAPSYNLVGIYNSLEASGTVTALTGLAYTSLPAGIQGCIEETDTSCPPANMNTWDLCVQSASKSQTALLNFKLSSGGLSTNVQYAGC